MSASTTTGILGTPNPSQEGQFLALIAGISPNIIVQFATGNSATSSSFTVTLGATPTVGNTLLAVGGSNIGNSAIGGGSALTVTGGFTVLSTYTNGGGGKGQAIVAYRVIQGGDGTSYTFNNLGYNNVGPGGVFYIIEIKGTPTVAGSTGLACASGRAPTTAVIPSVNGMNIVGFYWYTLGNLSNVSPVNYTNSPSWFSNSTSNANLVVSGTTPNSAVSATYNSIYTGSQDIVYTVVQLTNIVQTTGTVAFYDNIDGALGTATVANNSASLQVNSLTPATHTVTATYSGDSNYSTSFGSFSQAVSNYSPGSPHYSASSDLISQQVYPKGAVDKALTSSLAPSLSGEAVTFTITVQAHVMSEGTPTGTVTLHDSLGSFPDQVLTLAPVSGVPTAAYGPTTALSVGSHTLTATYSGDVNFDPSSSTLIQLVLTPKGDILFDMPGFAIVSGYSSQGDTNLPSWASFSAVPSVTTAGTPVYILWTSNNVVAVEIAEISGSPPYPPVVLTTGGSGIYEFPEGFATSTLLLCTGFDSLGNAVATENVLVTILGASLVQYVPVSTPENFSSLNLTLTDSPSPGNLLVITNLRSDSSHDSTTWEPAGFSHISHGYFNTPGYNNTAIDVWTRTVQEGDGKSFTVNLTSGPAYPQVFFMGEVSGAGTPVVSYGNLTSNGSTPVVDVTGGTLVIMMDSIYDGGVTHSISPSSYSQLYTDQFITNSPAVFAGSGDVPDAAITDAAIGYGTPPVNGPYLLVTVPYSS